MSDQPHDPNPAHTLLPDVYPPLQDEQPEVPAKHRSMAHRMHDLEHMVASMKTHMEDSLGFKVAVPPPHYEVEEEDC